MSSKIIHPLTKYVNDKQKAASKIAKDIVTNWLIHEFPQAFETTQQIRPLKCGIINDIILYAHDNAPEISKTKIKQAIAKFTRSIEYLTCLKAQEMRIDLYGNPTVPVTHDEAMAAAQKIKIHIEKQIQLCPAETKNAKPNNSSLNNEVREIYLAKPERDKLPEITIKPKKRTFDESAIIRMKEKLGLNQNGDR